MKRWLLRAVLLLLLLVVGGGFLLARYADRLVKTGIETGGSHAMGVETRVDSVGLGLFSGSLSLGGLRVDNPAGFEGHFLSLDRGDVAVSLRSLLSDTVEIPLFRLDGLDVTLFEYTGGSNYGSILDHIGRTAGGGKGTAGGSGAGRGGKGFLIRELELTRITAHVSVGLGGREVARVDVNIPEIRLKNVGSASDGGAALEEVMGILVQALLQGVAASGVDLPGGLLGDLRGRLAGLGGLDELGFQLSGGVSSSARETVDKLKSAAEAIQQGLGGELRQDVEEAVKGLDFLKKKD